MLEWTILEKYLLVLSEWVFAKKFSNVLLGQSSAIYLKLLLDQAWIHCQEGWVQSFKEKVISFIFVVVDIIVIDVIIDASLPYQFYVWLP